jgi:hypothetical protein
MLALSRGLLAGLLILGLAVLGAAPGGLSAQDKKDTKDPKKDPPVVNKDPKKKDDTGDKKVGFATSDGLSLNGYWYQGVGVDKQRPDAVMMFPAPGSKVTDAWIDLARKLSEKNFSVLLFDWRGCGMNGLDVGSRVFESPEVFWRELYNQQLLKSRKTTIDDKGLDYKNLSTASNNLYRYRDFMLNDLMGARFFLDKQNDNGKCNTNRVWIISEKEGAQLGLAFIAFEFNRNSIYNPKVTGIFEKIQTQPAGKNYAGLVALSYKGDNPTANAVYKNGLGFGNGSTEAKSHLETRLATVLLYSNKEKDGASKSLVNLLGASGTEDHMKKNFKYLRPIDVKDKPINGIGMIDTTDSFEVMKTVQTAMVEISKVQNFGKDATDREANKMTVVPRFPAEIMGRR